MSARLIAIPCFPTPEHIAVIRRIETQTGPLLSIPHMHLLFFDRLSVCLTLTRSVPVFRMPEDVVDDDPVAGILHIAVEVAVPTSTTSRWSAKDDVGIGRPRSILVSCLCRCRQNTDQEVVLKYSESLS